MQAHVVEGVLHCEIRGRQIVVTRCYHHLHVRILSHGLAQQASGVAEAVLDAVIPRLNPTARVIVHVGLVAELVAIYSVNTAVNGGVISVLDGSNSLVSPVFNEAGAASRPS